jgi:hypothetical protein
MSGYAFCGCRDCSDITISSEGEPALCWECEASYCTSATDYPEMCTYSGAFFECQRGDAYGMEESNV